MTTIGRTGKSWRAFVSLTRLVMAVISRHCELALTKFPVAAALSLGPADRRLLAGDN